MEIKPQILVVTQYSLPFNKRNMNAYQRLLFGASYARMILLMRSTEDASDELKGRVCIHKAPVKSRWLFLVYAMGFALLLRFKGCKHIMTEPSGFAAVGFGAKFLGAYTWVLDVWDRPRWRTGEHEAGKRLRASDRFVFFLMRFADLYLLSVLPPAARDIRPNPRRCVQLYNAIDLSTLPKRPPHRASNGDPTLHLAFCRSKFQETMGLDILLEAAAKLYGDKCPVVFHLVGHLPDGARQRIEGSPARGCFTLHGFVERPIELLRSIHAGLVPYPPYEDLSYIFPIKVLEHLSQGNPVIASDLPGISAMVRHEQNGLLIKPGDANDLAVAIARLQADYELFNRLAGNALSSIRQFDPAKKNRTIFEAILGAGAG